MSGQSKLSDEVGGLIDDIHHDQQTNDIRELEQSVILLQITDSDILAQLVLLVNKDITHDNQILSLISKDTAHDNQINSLQNADSLIQSNISSGYASLSAEIATKVGKTSDTGSANLPKGTTAQSDLIIGGIRFDTTQDAYVGKNSSGEVLIATRGDIPPAFPAGTRMGFNQTAAPTGWTKDTTTALNDSIMRIVTGAVSSGGSTTLTDFNSQTVVGSTTLTIAQMPSHGHAYTASGTVGAGTAKGSTVGTPVGSTTGAQGGGGSHAHSITTNIKYNDFIIASKN